jgi:AraC-like DNA-binding protein
VLADALRGVRLQAAVFLRAEYTERWSYESMPAFDTAQLLQPGADRVTLFHVVASGQCWISVNGGEVHWASAGDVIVIPYGDQHCMGGVEESVSVPIETLIVAPPWGQLPIIRHGAGGGRTDLVCGYLYSEDPLFDPSIRAFPPVLVVRPPDGPARDWVRSSIDYALQQTGLSAQGRPELPPFLPELLLAEVLRLHLESAPSATTGWLSALRDPVLAPAMAAIHAQPERKWTVTVLAREAHVSPSLLDERFRVALGMAPIRYLTGWRMHLARELLKSTHSGVAGIAHKVGYDSEEAFSRAFKRAHGMAPMAWRRTKGEGSVSQA